jgi:hypothetical protein
MSDSGTDNIDGADSTGAFEIMVIRVWMEPGHEHQFRARLTFGNESRNAGSAIVSSVPNDVVDAVRDWLEKVQATEKNSEALSSPDEPQP